MVVHLSADRSDVPFEFTVDANSLDISSEEVSYFGNAKVEGMLVYIGGGYLAEGKITIPEKFVCNRCLEDTEKVSTIEFSERFTETEEDDATLFTGDKIDITEAVRETIIAGESMSHLCKEDCKGLCKICGKDLNEGDCGCDRFVPDPRFSVLENYTIDE